MINPPSSKAEPLFAPSSGGASLGEATLSLAKTCIGTGVLALPYGFVVGGSLSLPGLAALGLWNWWTCLQLLQSRAALARGASGLDPDSVGPRRSTYSALVRVSLGARGERCFEVAMSAMMLGVCASLQIQGATLLAAVTGLDYAPCVGLTALLLLPLVLARSIRRLSLVSGAALGVLALGVAAVIEHGLARFGVPAAAPALSALPSPSGFAQFFGIAGFSFGLQARGGRAGRARGCVATA